MSCQSLSCDAEPLQNFHRSVHFSTDNERKSMECSLEYHGDDSSDISGAWCSSWSSQAMSRSAPASCPIPLSTGPTSLESTSSVPSARFPRLEECAHFHYGRVQLGRLCVRCVETDIQSAHQENDQDNAGWITISVRPHCDKKDETASALDQSLHKDQESDSSEWLVTRNADNFKMLDTMLHRCIYDRKVSGLPDLSVGIDDKCLEDRTSYESLIRDYLHHFSIIADDTINCGPILNWFQMDNKGHKLLVANEDSNSINTPAVAAAYSVRRYVSQARDEISFEVGDMISVIDMPGPSESTWWRGKRGFRVGFFPQHCVAVIGDKVPRNMKQPPPIVGSVSMAPIKPVLRKHGKLISLFRSFILSRPSRRSLRQQGILKERVFGCDLGEHLLNSGYEVPQVLTWCASIIEEHGCVDGIYRLSGASSATQRLRFAFDEERPPSNPPSPLDVHAVASLLKMYFRELPNPLCTFQLYSCFVSAVKLTDPGDGTELRRLEDSEKLIRMRETVVKLPPPHYRTLAFLMRHLHKMSLLGPSTGMTARNMGIVWAPNLLRSPLQEFSLSGVAIQVVVTEFLICYAELIFSDEQPIQEPSDIRDYNESLDSIDSQLTMMVKRPKSLPIATPTKLLSLEEARNKQQLRPSSTKEPHYIEVGEGPNSLPRYHTIIQLPSGSTKRGLKRSPSGWKGLFFRATKHRSLPVPTIQPVIGEPKELQIIESSNMYCESNKVEEQTSQKMTIDEVGENRSSRSCESLGSEGDKLPPLVVQKETPIQSSHNRSASCDSYFEASLAELAGMRLRLTSQEREMDIFSEDDTARQVWNKDESSSGDTTAEPSPIKFPRTVPKVANPPDIKCSPPDNIMANKIEEQLSDMLFIDCSTPEHTAANNLRLRSGDLPNIQNKHPEHEKDRFLSVNNARIETDNSNQTNPQHSTTIKVRMRDRGSPRKLSKANIARHSHCGPSSSLLTEITPQRHSTLIRVDWLESEHANPNLCGYTELQSDSDTSLQIMESKDSLARRLIESKESLLSTTLEEKSDVFNESPSRNNLQKSSYSDNCEDVTETFTGLITKRASSENLDGSVPFCGAETFNKQNNGAKSLTNINTPVNRPQTSIFVLDQSQEKDNELKISVNTVVNKECNVYNVPTSENDKSDNSYENENRYSIIVTPNDENNTHNIADSLDGSLSPTNISYQNLNRLSMLSGDSGKGGLSKESTPTYSSHEQERTEEIYECFNFTKPSYVHLASSSDGSSPISSPQNKSPLKSTINIVYKSPTKDNVTFLKNSTDKNVDDRIYEDVENQDETPVVNKTTFADLSLQNNKIFSDTDKKNEPGVDSDIYNKVKFFRQSVNEVNSLIMESEKENTDGLTYEDSLDANTKFPSNDNGRYENVSYTQLPAEKHDYENVNMKCNSEVLTPLTELCLDRRLQDNKSNSDLKIDHAYENFHVKIDNESVKHKPYKLENVSKVNMESKTVLKTLGESDKENSDENENIAPTCNEFNKRSSVKQLAHKFESPTENKGPFFFDRSSKTNLSTSEKIKEESSYSFDRNKAVSFCEGRGKINMTGRTVPCVRARNNRLSKYSNNARSLDENAFVKEFGSQALHKDHISEMQINDQISMNNRRKSLEALKCLNQPKKLPDLNLNIECNKKCPMRSDLSLNLTSPLNDLVFKGTDRDGRLLSITPTTENKISLVQARFSPKKNRSKQSSNEFVNKSCDKLSSDTSLDEDRKDQLSRERIEKYKEERRLILREKYSSQSFRGLNDLQLTAKKGSKIDDDEFDGVQLRNPGKLERRNTADAAQRSKFSSKDVKQNDGSEFTFSRPVESDGLKENFLNSMTSKVSEGNFDANKPRITGMQRKFSLDAASVSKNQEPKTNWIPHTSANTSSDAKSLNSGKYSERPKTLGAFGIPTSAVVSEERCLSEILKEEVASSVSSKKEKRSPSFNIKDMAAKFEQKSLNNRGGQL